MGRRKWKLYQDVLLARNLPLQQPDQSASPVEPSSADSHSLPEALDLDPQANQTSEGEDRPMIATTEALQRNNSATDLTQDPQDLIPKKDQEKQPDLSISLDEDLKEVQDLKTEDGPSSILREENCSTPQTTTLKIKTIEEINTVGGNSNNGGGGPTETILESLIKRSSTGPPRKPQPVDWRPQDKCYFCVDGELVRPGVEQTPTAPEPPPVSLIIMYRFPLTWNSFNAISATLILDFDHNVTPRM